MGNLAARQEGEKVSEEHRLERNKICIQKELAESRGEEFYYSADESEEVKEQRKLMAEIETKYAG